MAEPEADGIGAVADGTTDPALEGKEFDGTIEEIGCWPDGAPDPLGRAEVAEGATVGALVPGVKTLKSGRLTGEEIRVGTTGGRLSKLVGRSEG